MKAKHLPTAGVAWLLRILGMKHAAADVPRIAAEIERLTRR
jgi:hypothetical protein